MEQLRFSIPEILSLIGLSQCLYVLVYMLFRAGDRKQILLPAAYFLVLGTAFFLDFAQGFIAELTIYYPVFQWFFWFLGLPVSVLLVIQIAKIRQLPALPHYGVLFLLPLAYGAAVGMALHDESCIFPAACPSLHDWLVITGLIAGAVSMLAIWGQRGLLEGLYREKAGKERYWLVLMLICVNLFFLTTMLLSLTPFVTEGQAGLIRTFLGLGLVYLAGTSLFRIYPQSLILVSRIGKEDMSAEELSLARRIERLLDMEKIYQESAYGRAELARELEVSETIISKVINLHFGKNFPQLLNERRVEDAKQLLRETNASVKVIAEDVGFNSTASFNRVFRDLTGLSPSAYRNEQS
ncbi:MAG: helix-turn-helix transcriptional regulator [Rhodospirillales bacterium]|nr:helix-turn-helix transcriptional regulator [Rhodospirillales bacterium]